MWIIYAILSAVFASLTAILSKIGMAGIHSNLATAIRTIVVLVMAWGLVFLTGQQHNLGGLTKQNWIFLILSGVATGLSWLFYFQALQTGDASVVVPIDKFSVVITMVLAFLFLGEKMDTQKLVGGGLITLGTLVLVIKWPF